MADRGDPDSGDDILLGEAFDWVIRLTSGDATVGDAEALARWRAQSSAHERSFVKALRLRNALQAAGKELADMPRSAAVVQISPPRRSHGVSRRVLLGGAVAASAAGLLIARPPLGLWPSFTELSADYRTATGERREVTLSDGTKLDLNTQTSIVLRSSPGTQSIELVTGEAAVVTTERPFSISAASGRVIAAEARFNVRHLDERVCVTCLDGAVDVMWQDQSVRLKPEQQVFYSTDEFGSPTPVDPFAVSAWQRGLLIFHDEPLAAVIKEVNRYRVGKIFLTKPELGSLLVNGVFHLDRLDGVIAQVRGLGAEVTTLPGGFVLLS